jgi:hypothetical protein
MPVHSIEESAGRQATIGTRCTRGGPAACALKGRGRRGLIPRATLRVRKLEPEPLFGSANILRTQWHNFDAMLLILSGAP